jgi:hypothetical protein
MRGGVGVTARLMSDQELARLEVVRDLDRKTVDEGGGGSAVGA